MHRSFLRAVLAAVAVAACGSSSSSSSSSPSSSPPDAWQPRPGEDPTPPDVRAAELATRRAEYIALTPRMSRRLESYGIELEIPADITLPGDGGHGQRVLMQSFGCAVHLVVDPPFSTAVDVLAEDLINPVVKLRSAEFARTDDGWRLREDLELTDGSLRGQTYAKSTVFRRVGATPVACDGESDCVDWLCAKIRAVPGGPAETPHRTTTPAIAIEERHGQGFFVGGIEVWRDGLVHYFGPRCPTWRGREASVDPSRVQEAITALTGLTAADLHRTGGCADCSETHVRVRSALARRWFTFTHGNSPAMERALGVVRDAVGHNPCM